MAREYKDMTFTELLDEFRQEVYSYASDEGRATGEEYSYFMGDRTKADAIEVELVKRYNQAYVEGLEQGESF